MKNSDTSKIEIKTIIIRLICSFVTAVFFVLGNVIDKYDSAQLMSLSMWVKVFIFTAVCFTVVCAIDIANRRIKLLDKCNIKEPPKLAWIAAPAVMYVVALLACFPGVFSYDCYEEWMMVAENSITNHHPALHVLILGGLTEFSQNAFGNGNVGILVYVILQIAFSLFVVRRLAVFLEERDTNNLVKWISLLFLSLSPVVLMFITATTKDTIFCLFELWFIICGLRVLRKCDKLSWKLMAETVVSAVGTMIFRKNGIYIATVALFLMLILAGHARKKMLLIIGVSIGIYIVYNLGIYNLVGVTKGKSAEMLSVPIQQLSRTYNFDYDELSDTEKAMILEYMPEEYISSYIPSTADAVKMGFNSELFDADPIRFIKLWAGVGVKHPLSYINAFMANTVDFWYPLAKIDGYRWLYGLDQSISTFFDYRVAPPGEQVVLIKPVHDLLYKLSTDYDVTQKIYTSIFLSPGWYILIWIWSIGVKAGDKKGRVFFNIVMLLSLLTVMAGPMALVRYVLIFYFALPLELAFMCKNRKSDA